MILSILSEPLAVCKLPPGSPVPAWANEGDFCSITRTAEELSIVCAESRVPPADEAVRGWRSQPGWRALKVQGPLDFSLVGILAQLSGVLAQANISLFAISTFDTDYLLVRENDLSAAVNALRAAGHSIYTAA